MSNPTGNSKYLEEINLDNPQVKIELTAWEVFFQLKKLPADIELLIRRSKSLSNLEENIEDLEDDNNDLVVLISLLNACFELESAWKENDAFIKINANGKMIETGYHPSCEIFRKFVFLKVADNTASEEEVRLCLSNGTAFKRCEMQLAKFGLLGIYEEVRRQNFANSFLCTMDVRMESRRTIIEKAHQTLPNFIGLDYFQVELVKSWTSEYEAKYKKSGRLTLQELHKACTMLLYYRKNALILCDGDVANISTKMLNEYLSLLNPEDPEKRKTNEEFNTATRIRMRYPLNEHKLFLNVTFDIFMEMSPLWYDVESISNYVRQIKDEKENIQ